MKTPDARRLDKIESRLFIETFEIRLPDGRVWEGTLWKSATRPEGRRIQVRTLPPDSFGLWDSGDCFCVANATNKLDNWLGQFLPRGHLPEVEPELVEALEIAREGPVDAQTAS